MKISKHQQTHSGTKINAKEKEDLILVICPPWDTKMPSLGVACLSSYLKEQGHKHSILDLNINIYNKIKHTHKELWNLEKLHLWVEKNRFKKILKILKPFINECVNKILSKNTNIICFSTNVSNTFFSLEIAKEIKNKDSKKIIIFGGPGTGGDYEYLNHEKEYILPSIVDILVTGEGEETLCKIINNVHKGKRLKEIPGLILSENNLFCSITKKKLIKEIDKLPFPTYKKFDLNKYSTKVLPILFSRGCPNKCAYCADYNIASTYRYRKAENIFKEIKYHIEENNISVFQNADLLINGNLKELEKLCDLIIKNKLQIQWGGPAIIRKDLKYTLLVKMKKAGCNYLSFGIETGSDNILRKMNKPFTVKDAEKILKLTTEAKINTSINLIVGFPGEIDSDFKKTLSFLKKNKNNIKSIGNINTCFFVRNSELYNNPEKYSVILPDVTITKSYYMWYNLDGNNYESRRKKVKKVISLLSELGIEHVLVGLYEEMTITTGNPFKLFFECLKDHGLSYTLTHTKYFLQSKLLLNKEVKWLK